MQGTLRGVKYTIIVTKSEIDGRRMLEAMTGLSGGSRTVDGTPIQDTLKRSGPIVIVYPGAVRPDMSHEIEACFGDHARFDPDLLVGLRAAGCSGAAGTAVAELGRPESVSSWRPDHVEGGGCVANFTTELSAQRLVAQLRAELRSNGWTVSSPLGEGFGLLYMTRDGLVAVVSREAAQRYSLYITPAQNLG